MRTTEPQTDGNAGDGKIIDMTSPPADDADDADDDNEDITLGEALARWSKKKIKELNELERRASEPKPEAPIDPNVYHIIERGVCRLAHPALAIGPNAWKALRDRICTGLFVFDDQVAPGSSGIGHFMDGGE